MRGWDIGGDTGWGMASGKAVGVPRTVGRARAHWQHYQPDAVVEYRLGY